MAVGTPGNNLHSVKGGWSQWSRLQPPDAVQHANTKGIVMHTTEHHGSVIRLYLDRGYGFIGEVDGPDYFFHFNDVHWAIDWDEQLEAHRVRFDVTEGDRGPRAVNVRAAD